MVRIGYVCEMKLRLIFSLIEHIVFVHEEVVE